jgi:SAM-dependent methyltransferase
MPVFYESFSTWGKILFLLAVLLVIVNGFERPRINEGFTVRGYSEKTNENLYDEFYSQIYDYIVFSDTRNEYEVGEIVNRTNPTQQSLILDIGCGTGNTVNLLKNRGLNITGVDQSSDMISKAISKYPSLKKNMVQGDVLQVQLFSPYRFTHILCLYFTVYYIRNKTLFFENVYDWLRPGGYFIIHLVNRDKFSPLLPMNSYQRRNKNGKYSKIQFVDFDYDANFELFKSANQGVFSERFRNFSGETRKQKHTFYMEDQKTILSIAQQIGFIVEGIIDMQKVKYDHQFLYILKKPN